MFSRFTSYLPSFSSSSKATVAPLPTSTAQNPFNVGSALPVTPEPTTDLGRARKVYENAEEERRRRKKERNDLDALKARWYQRGDDDTSPASRSIFRPSTWFSKNIPTPKREFTNATPKNKRKLQLNANTLRKLGKNASVLGKAMYDQEKNVILNPGVDFTPPEGIDLSKDTPTLDLSDYVIVMVSTGDTFTEEEKIERFKHLFLLIEIFEGKRTINETIYGSQKNVFADPKRSILNWFGSFPRSIKKYFLSGLSSEQKIGSGVILLVKVTGAALSAVLGSPILVAAGIMQQANKSLIIKQASDVVRLLNAYLDLGKEKNPIQ
jgi:hypothetical protein